MKENLIILRVDDADTDVITADSSFLDVQGFCYANIVDEDYDSYVSSFSTKFRVDMLYDTTVLLTSIVNGKLLGWYTHATAYKSGLTKIATNLDFIVSCKVEDGFLIKQKYRPVILDEKSLSQSFLFPDKSRTNQLIKILENLKTTAQFIPIKLSLKSNAINNRKLTKKHDELFDLYEKTGDVHLLPSILQELQDKINKFPDDIYLLLKVANILFNLVHLDEALNYYEQIISLDKNHNDSIYYKSLCLIRLNRLEEAIEWINKALANNNEDDLKFLLMTAYERMGYLTNAYEIAISIETEEAKEAIADWLQEVEVAMPYLSMTNEGDILPNAYPLFLLSEQLVEIKTQLNRHNNVCYLDLIRNKHVIATPEEKVRQQLILFLITHLNIPRESIKVEENLSHLDSSLRDRVDILVNHNSSKGIKPLLLIECKAPGVALLGDATRQLLRYNHILHTPYIMLSNGKELHIYHFEKETKRYQALSVIPCYEDMLQDISAPIIQSSKSKWIRPAFEILTNNRIQDVFIDEGIVGEGTPDILRPIILNLAFCLLDENRMLPCPLVVPGCTVTTDHGVMSAGVGNQGSGRYDSEYRWISAIDRNGQNHNVYFSVLGTAKLTNDPHWGNTGGYTSLIVGIEEKGIMISRLQIHLDTCLKPEIDKYRLTHDGRRSAKKIQPLIDYVAIHVPELLGNEERIMLGYLNNSKNLYMSDPQVAQTIGRIVSYTILRSELQLLEKKQ